MFTTHMRAALVTGANGQDGSYLIELLLSKGYRVTGVVRKTTSRANLEWLASCTNDPKFKLVLGDVSDAGNILRIVRDFYAQNAEAERHEVYHLAAQSHVQVSFELPAHALAVNAGGTLHVLEAILAIGNPGTFRFYQASTSEMYGKVREIPQRETTPFHPRSPYACAKMAAYWITVNYREAHGVFACNGILFNHESPRRGELFVTRKITMSVAAIANGSTAPCDLGNMDALRDWGHAKDYVEGMWRILQHDAPDDYVLATGEQHSVREFAELAFQRAGMRLAWSKDDESGQEVGLDVTSGRVVVRGNQNTFLRPAEVETLLGDPSKAKRVLGWSHTHTFQDIVNCMVDADLRRASATAPVAHPLAS